MISLNQAENKNQIIAVIAAFTLQTNTKTTGHWSTNRDIKDTSTPPVSDPGHLINHALARHRRGVWPYR